MTMLFVSFLHATVFWMGKSGVIVSAAFCLCSDQYRD